ncbi:MAG: hypothetical protein QMC83_02940 [Thermodesulfovibrionales bacterium]|nr:hypothetical protein [Thermodesulfovibrionales bacterium]
MKTIDIHTHGIGGYDIRTTAEEDILKIAEILGSYGVSEIILTVYSAPLKVMMESMMAVKKAMEKQKDISNPPPPFSKRGHGGINHPSRIIGVHLEGPFLNPSKCGALNAMTFIELTEYNLRELLEGFEDIVKIITIAPEIKGATGFIKKISDRGIIVSMGHSDATFSEAEAGLNAGARGITHIFNAMRGFHHREPGIAGFGLLNKDIYIEVIADPFHLHPKTLELIFRTKNPGRIIIVSDSVKETPSPSLPPFAITDTQGRLRGGSMTIVESSKRLIQMGFDKVVIMGCITTNPERYLSV